MTDPPRGVARLNITTYCKRHARAWATFFICMTPGITRATSPLWSPARNHRLVHRRMVRTSADKFDRSQSSCHNISCAMQCRYRTTDANSSKKNSLHLCALSATFRRHARFEHHWTPHSQALSFFGPNLASAYQPFPRTTCDPGTTPDENKDPS